MDAKQAVEYLKQQVEKLLEETKPNYDLANGVNVDMIRKYGEARSLQVHLEYISGAIERGLIR